jgi:hypothetical protein
MGLPHESSDSTAALEAFFRKGAKAQNGSMSDMAIYHQLISRAYTSE